MQENFLSELEMSASETLLDFNLAPLRSRRDISMLGLLHRIVLKDAPVQFSKYVYGTSTHSRSRGWAVQFDRHNHQLHDPLNSPVPKIVERSIFKLIHPYNVLPQFVLDWKSTAAFQRKLQSALKECVADKDPEWESLLCKGVVQRGVHNFRSWFSVHKV